MENLRKWQEKCSGLTNSYPDDQNFKENLKTTDLFIYFFYSKVYPVKFGWIEGGDHG